MAILVAFFCKIIFTLDIHFKTLWRGKVKKMLACYIFDSIRPLIMALMQDCLA